MAKDKKTVCVDLDGVLARYNGFKGIDHFDDPFPGAREFLTDLRKVAKVVIFTTRASVSAHGNCDWPARNSVAELKAKVVAWLRKWELPFDDVWTAAGKPIASAYVDDRAVPCAPGKSARYPDLGFSHALQRCKALVDSSHTASTGAVDTALGGNHVEKETKT